MLLLSCAETLGDQEASPSQEPSEETSGDTSEENTEEIVDLDEDGIPTEEDAQQWMHSYDF